MQTNTDEHYVDSETRIPTQILDAEIEVLDKRRTAVGLRWAPEKEPDAPVEDAGGHKKPVGLALSGGGIRSASFSLGVMQALAAAKYLKHVDYLSTVSGGGYIGGSLTWLLSKDAGRHKGSEAFGTGDEKHPDGTDRKFPYGTENPAENRLRHEDENRILRHLRLHGKYLAPGKGITMTSFAAVTLRGILLNLLVWLPLITALMVAVLFASHALSLALPGDASWAAIEKSFSTIGERLNWAALGQLKRATLQEGTVGTGLLIVALLAVAFFALACIIYSFAARFSPEGGRYSGRRMFESRIRWPLIATAVSFVLGSLPYVHGVLKDSIEETGAVSLLAGAVIGLFSFMKSGEKGGGKLPLGLLVPVGSALFLYGLALTTYSAAFLYFEDTVVYRYVLLGFVVIAVATGVLANLNYISLHRYYRDRLMETFMPDPDTEAKTGRARGANNAELSKMWSAEAAHAPYHLVNTNVVLVDSNDHRFRVRGGDSFLLSPLYCGSTATGWRETSDYMKDDAMTLPTAVAISGAAANPNTGVGGEGATRNKLLSLLMSLLNLRLGAWVPNPKLGKGRRHGTPNHFRAAYYELSPNGYNEKSKFLQISDGGHFENLAVYELIRRKVKLIICCDGGADPEFSFADLQVLLRRIGSDFGVNIDFEQNDHLERIIPRKPDPQGVIARDPNVDAYPVGVKFAERGYIKGTIHYPDTESGTLILLKTTMAKGLDLTLKGYKGKHPDFPDESTADQFFDEEQFDAYRELGYIIADQMINDQSVDFEGLLAECASRV